MRLQVENNNWVIKVKVITIKKETASITQTFTNTLM